MIHSVYNYRTQTYDYYEGLAAPPTTGFQRKPSRMTGAAEDFAAKVPAGAQLVGSGSAPRGMIATLGSAPEPSSPAARFAFLLGGLALVGGIAWVLSPKKRRA